MNFSRIREAAFLYDCLKFHDTNIFNVTFFHEALYKYIDKSEQDESNRSKWYWHAVSVLRDRNNQKIKELKEFILEKEQGFSSFLESKYNASDRSMHAAYEEFLRDRSSSEFLIALLNVQENLPMLVISPDHDKSNPDSPLLAFIIPSVSAFNELQYAVHGEDATDPFFTLGNLSLD